MLGHARVFVVIPARQEEERVGQVIATLPSWVDAVVVVDDASDDATSECARAAAPGVIVVRHGARRGVGGAIVTGYRESLARGADVVAVMAGDGQMCPDDLERVVAPVVAGRADYVKGERFSHPGVLHLMPTARYVAGRVLSALTAGAVGAPITDSQCGYTAISRDALGAIDLDAVWLGYGYPNDLFGHLVRAGCRVREVPVRPVYRGEKSGLRPWHVGVILGLVTRAAALRAANALARTTPSRAGAPARPTAS